MVRFVISKLRNNEKIVRNAGYLSIIEVIRLVMPFVALPYIISTVGADNYGLTVFAQTIISYFTIFINWGLDISAVKDVSVNRNDSQKLNRVVSTVLGIKFILFLSSFVVLLVCIMAIPFMRGHKWLFIYAFLSCLSEILFPVWFYQGIEKMKYLTLIRITAIIFYTISVFLFIHVPADYEKVVLLQSLGNVIAGCLSLYMLLVVNKVRFLLPDYQYIKSTFVGSFPFFMSRVSVIFNNTIAKTVSGIFFTMESVAAFDLAQKIATAALIPMKMMNQAVYPHIAKTKSVVFVRKYLTFDILLSLFIALVVAIMAPFVIPIFAKGQLAESVSILQILCVWVFLGGITTYIGSPVLVSFGYPKPFNFSVILSTLILFILYLLCFLTGCLTVYNFAWVLAISEFVILLYRGYYCFHYQLINIG